MQVEWVDVIDWIVIDCSPISVKPLKQFYKNSCTKICIVKTLIEKKCVWLLDLQYNTIEHLQLWSADIVSC